MALADLVTSSRAQQNATLQALGRSNPAYLASLITAASNAIRRFCNRDFTSNSYSEYYDGGIYNREPLKLRQYPVSEISRVATMQNCLLIQNGGGTYQRAVVETLATGDFQITTVAMGVQAVTQLLAATYTTVGAMAAAINALGHGWGTTVLAGPAGAYNNFPTTDLKPLQGAASALVGGCWLEIAEDWYGWNSGAIWPDDRLEDAGGVAPFWRLDKDTGEVQARLPRGRLNIRIDYTAGFSAVPDAVIEATVQLVQWTYQMSAQNLAMKSVKLGDFGYTLEDSGKWPATVRNMLATFKDYSRLVYWA